jgi:hypothetical protein
MNFPSDFEIFDNPIYPGVNYIYRREDAGLISILSKPNGTYEVYDTEYMSGPEIMTWNDLNIYMSKEPARFLLRITPERLN